VGLSLVFTGTAATGGGVPKVSVYLSDDRYRRVREQGLPLSPITQAAVERARRTSERLAWVEQMRSRPRRVRRATPPGEIVTAPDVG
jgi:post-segregation antitoxin (ccd killing protein)